MTSQELTVRLKHSAMISSKIAFLLYILVFISLSVAKGSIAPLIHRSSPESPFYDPNLSDDDIMRENQRISIARARHFGKNKMGGQNSISPITREVVMGYYIGTPPVQTYGVFDTCSDLTWVQCRPCVHCYNQRKAKIFDPKESSTYKKVSCIHHFCDYAPDSACTSIGEFCSYRLTYGDGAYSYGYLSTENFIIASNLTGPKTSLRHIYFGCGINNGDPSHEGVPGVVGLQNSRSAFVHQMVENKFSYCYKRRQMGGSIRFGSDALLLGDKTPLIPNRYHNYHLILEGITVGLSGNLNISSDLFKMGNDSIDERGFVIDSGSSYTFLHPVAFDALVKEIKKILNRPTSSTLKGWELCYDLDSDLSLTMDAMPTLQFLFRNFAFSPPLENIWTDKDGWGNVCLAMFRAETPFSVLGLYSHSSFNVGFDLDNGILYMDYQEKC